MSEMIHLVGAETVERAAGTMRAAAESMMNAANTIVAALERHERALQSFLLEEAEPEPILGAVLEGKADLFSRRRELCASMLVHGLELHEYDDRGARGLFKLAWRRAGILAKLEQELEAAEALAPEEDK